MSDIIPLRYFLAAYDAGSFTRAAQVLRVKQPSVSAAIAKLEGQMGGRLFERSRAGLRPTGRGEALYADAAPIVAQLDALAGRMQPQAAQVMRIFCQPDILLAPFAGPLAALVRQRPQVSLRFCDDVAEADLGFVAQDCAPAGTRFRALRRESYGVAVKVGHVLTQAGALTFDDLAGQPVIGRPYCPAADRFAKAGMPEVVAEASNDHQLLDLVAAGLGIAVVPEGHVAGRAGITLLPLPGVVQERVVGLMARKSVQAAQVAALLGDLIVG